MKKAHSLPDKSFGEPVDEPEQKWASLHIKFHHLSIRNLFPPHRHPLPPGLITPWPPGLITPSHPA
jgi:hypothetical protein